MRALILIVLLAVGCSTLTVNDNHYATLGIATVIVETETERCVRYFKDGLLIKEVCEKKKDTVETETDAFSGWNAIMEGLSSAVVKIITLGFFPF